MPRRRGSCSKLVSKPLLMFNSAIESQPNLHNPRLPPKVPSSPPSSVSSVNSSPNVPSCSAFEPTITLGPEDCEILADYDDPAYEALKEEAYLGTLGALQGRRSRKRDSASHCPLEQLAEQFHRPRLPSPTAYDSLSRRLSTISTGSKRRTLRLSKSTPSLTPAPQPVISHPMPLGSARRLRKVPSIQRDPPPKSRLSALPRMFAWRL